MDTGLFLDFIGIRLDSRKAEGLEYKSNLITPDNGEKYAIDEGIAKAEGDTGILGEIASRMVDFEIGFEILPGTAAPPVEGDLDAYAVPEASSNVRAE